MKRVKTHNKKIIALAIGGGGCKGFLEAAILTELERKTNKKCTDIFGAIAGTSIGAIQASLLSVNVPARECLQFFIDDGPIIFNKHWWTKFNPYAKYSGEVIESILKQRLKDKTLKDTKCHLLIPCVDIKTKETFFFKSYDGKDYPLWLASRCSSAAQSYFSLVPLEDKLLVDGGNSCNLPSRAIYDDLHKMGYKDKNIKILALSCGNQIEKQVNWSKYINPNIFRVLELTLSTLFEAAPELVNYSLKEDLGDNYLSINPKYKQNLTIDGASPKDIKILEDVSRQIIKDNFWQIEEFLDL